MKKRDAGYNLDHTLNKTALDYTLLHFRVENPLKSMDDIERTSSVGGTTINWVRDFRKAIKTSVRSRKGI